MFRFFFSKPRIKISSCSPYTIINNQTKRYTNAVCRNNNISCIIQTLCNCNQSESTSDNITTSYNSNNTQCPFIYQAPIESFPPNYYEISISGSNEVTDSLCSTTINMSVNCTGLFVGYFPDGGINTSTFQSSAVENVLMSVNPTANNYPIPSPLLFLFNVPPNTNAIIPSGYTDGVCTLNINGSTYDLVKEGLDGINWTWNDTDGTWFSTIILTLPWKQYSPGGNTQFVNYQIQINFTLNNNTTSDQTWLQMNATMFYNGGTFCPSSPSGSVTVAGKMTSIALYTN